MNHRRPHRHDDEGSFRRHKRSSRMDAERLRDTATLLFAAVAVVSLGMVLSIVTRSLRTRSLSRELSELHGQAQEETAQDAQAAQQDGGVELPFDAVYGATEEPSVMEAPGETAAPGATPAPVTELEGYAAAQATAAPAGDAVKTTAFHRYGGTALPEMETLYARNHDLVGWLTIDEVLDLPLVYRDNSYYLTHDFDRNKSTSGTLFLDENHPLREKTQNLLLHGHNMKDGTMFGRLTQYEQSIDYLKAHPFVELSTLWEKETYAVFAVLVVSLDVKDERFFDYFSHPTFSSDIAFSAYIRELELRSMYAIPMDVKPSDALLTLSTCMGEDRLVIVCRRVRQGESRSSLRETIRLAAKQ